MINYHLQADYLETRLASTPPLYASSTGMGVPLPFYYYYYYYYYGLLTYLLSLKTTINPSTCSHIGYVCNRPSYHDTGRHMLSA